MAFRKNILMKYLHEEEIYHIIWHDSWEYIKLILLNLVYLIIVFWIYYAVSLLWNRTIVSIIIWVVALIIYIKFTLDFLDIFLDAIILTNYWVVIFKWEWILTYSSESVERTWLQAIFDEQSWILDILLNKWDIKIKRHDEIYTFKNIHNPWKEKYTILQMNERIQKQLSINDESVEENNAEQWDEKIEVLLDVLKDVLMDYKK